MGKLHRLAATPSLRALRPYAALALLAAMMGILPDLAYADPSCPPCAAQGTAAAGTASVPLDLNNATEADLVNLPGVGPAKAKAILAFREAKGRFHSVSQLLRIKGFGRATVARLRPLVMVEAQEIARETRREPQPSAPKSGAESTP